MISNCNSTLEVEDGLDSFYCKYCGSKILIEGRSSDAIQAKVVMHQIDTKAEIAKAKLTHEKEMSKQSDAYSLKMIIALFLWCLLCIVGLYLTKYI